MKKITSLMCLALFAMAFIAGCDKKADVPEVPEVPAVPEVPST